MHGDRCRVLIGVGSLTPEKHGYKSFVGWGSFNESSAASVLYASGLVEKWTSEVELF